MLERVDNRYIVTEREVFHESDVLLTPYAADMASIDAARLGQFIDKQYEIAGIDPMSIDTGALILTGVAVRRSNARAIGELFAAQTGKFVSVERRRRSGDNARGLRFGRRRAFGAREATAS